MKTLKKIGGYVSAILFLILGVVATVFFARARKAEQRNEQLMAEALLGKKKEELEKQKERANDEQDAFERLASEYESKHRNN